MRQKGTKRGQIIGVYCIHYIVNIIMLTVIVYTLNPYDFGGPLSILTGVSIITG